MRFDLQIVSIPLSSRLSDSVVIVATPNRRSTAPHRTKGRVVFSHPQIISHAPRFARRRVLRQRCSFARISLLMRSRETLCLTESISPCHYPRREQRPANYSRLCSSDCIPLRKICDRETFFPIKVFGNALRLGFIKTVFITL